MPRIAGVDVPAGKRIEFALRYIYGIGPKLALRWAPTASSPVDETDLANRLEKALPTAGINSETRRSIK